MRSNLCCVVINLPQNCREIYIAYLPWILCTKAIYKLSTCPLECLFWKSHETQTFPHRGWCAHISAQRHLDGSPSTWLAPHYNKHTHVGPINARQYTKHLIFYLEDNFFLKESKFSKPNEFIFEVIFGNIQDKETSLFLSSPPKD